MKTGTLVGMPTPKPTRTVAKTPSKLSVPSGYKAQVTRAFKMKLAKHLTENLYLVKLSKQGENPTIQTIIDQLESLKLTNIQFKTQDAYTMTFILTATPATIKKLQKA